MEKQRNIYFLSITALIVFLATVWFKVSLNEWLNILIVGVLFMTAYKTYNTYLKKETVEGLMNEVICEAATTLSKTTAEINHYEDELQKYYLKNQSYYFEKLRIKGLIDKDDKAMKGRVKDLANVLISCYEVKKL